MKNYHYTEKRQEWLKNNNAKLRRYMREYMRIRRNSSYQSIVIKDEIITITFN